MTRLSHSLSRFRAAFLSAFVLTAGGLVACSGADSGNIGSSQAAATAIKGCDYSDYRPSNATLSADGYSFVARYLSGDPGGGKDITASEANTLSSGGFGIVLVWETTGTDASEGYNQGVSDATKAQSEAASVGEPSTRPIYFAIDFDAESSSASAINAYFQGVASVLGLSRTGVYGGYYIVDELFNQGLVTYAWQTYAWSGGQWDSRAQLRQTLDGSEIDQDEAVASDYGQWTVGGGSPGTGGTGSTGSGSSGGTGTNPASCTANGESGTCILTSTCTGEGGTYTPGFCPGAVDIECCTSGGASSGSGSASGSGSGHSTGGGTGCYSMTLSKTVSDNACVQDKANDVWYQCDNGSWVNRWTDPTACNGVYPL
jgi:hypothetical protein